LTNVYHFCGVSDVTLRVSKLRVSQLPFNKSLIQLNLKWTQWVVCQPDWCNRRPPISSRFCLDQIIYSL